MQKGEREPQSKQYRNETSIRRGGVWPLIERYARLGLTPLEVIIAQRLEQQEPSPYEKIENALRKARQRNKGIKRPTGKELHDNRADALNITIVEREARVSYILGAEKILIEKGLTDIPQGRTDWLLLGEFVRARKEKAAGNDQPRRQLSEKMDTLTDEDIDRLRPCIDAIREITPTSAQTTRLTSESLVQHGEFKPDEFR